MANHSLRKLSPADFMKFQFIGRPIVSPCGKKVAYTVARPDPDKNDYSIAIWVYDACESTSTQFTHGQVKDRNPRWSPDGKYLAFRSNRKDDEQIWIMPTSGGEARQLTKIRNGLQDFEWSPDSSRIGFITKWDGTEEKPDDKKYKSDVKEYTRIKYKFDGGGFWDHKRRHVWVVDVASGEQTQLTTGDFDDDSIAWSPSGQEIAFVSRRKDDADFVNIRDLWVVNVKSKDLRQVFESIGPVSSPAWHPDGNLIGYVGHDNSQKNTTNTGLWVVEARGGSPRNLTASVDIAVGGSPTADMSYGVEEADWMWVDGGKAAYFVTGFHGEGRLYKVILDGAISEVVTGEGAITGFDVANGGEIYFSYGDHYHPGDLYVMKPGAEKRRLTAINKAILGEVDIAQVERMYFKGKDNWDIEGWLMKPAGFDPSKKYPMVLEVHGGPHAMYGAAFFLEFQLLAAKGFVVLFTNPRGSGGYGEAFTTACKGDWGGGDYQDLMLAVDQVIAKGFVDDKRMGVTGGSYGGFMTNWIVGHTDRFRAACTMRCVSNLYSFYGTSDIGFTFGDNEFPGNPWDNRDILWERSPFTYVKNIVTPLLILHSEQDHRCPIEQGEQMFTALKKLGREVQFVRFPDEGHNLSRSGKPQHRVERLERVIGWFEKHLL